MQNKRLPRRIVGLSTAAAVRIREGAWAKGYKAAGLADNLIVQQLRESMRLLQQGEAKGRRLGEIAGLEWAAEQVDTWYTGSGNEELINPNDLLLRINQLKEKL